MNRTHLATATATATGLLLATLVGTAANATTGANNSATTSTTRAADAAAPEGPGLHLNWSAFGTIGAAVSDRPWGYQRHIRNSVRFERDSVLGMQADIAFSPQWSATVQGRVAPQANDDGRWALTASWAFVAWRPDNDWLLRAGKLRVPFFLRSEQLEVGQTYDEARLPGEVYTLAPTNDLVGLHVSRSWAQPQGDWTLEAYVGNSDMYKRAWVRDPVPSPVPGQPPLLPAGSRFTEADVSVVGAVLTWRTPELTARAGVHHARTHLTSGRAIISQPAWVPLGPGIGYWQTDPSQPGPGPVLAPRIRNELYTLGADWRLGGGWRVAGELIRVQQHDTQLGVQGWSGYGTLYRSWGNVTPYLTAAVARSDQRPVDWQQRLDSTTVPAMAPGAAVLNAMMRTQADAMPVMRQQSLALGSSYALTPTSKLKLEWLHTRAGPSALVDVPAGQSLGQRRTVNVLSASYSFVY